MTGAEVAEHPFPSVYVTEYAPLVFTVMLDDVAEVDHTFPDA